MESMFHNETKLRHRRVSDSLRCNLVAVIGTPSPSRRHSDHQNETFSHDFGGGSKIKPSAAMIYSDTNGTIVPFHSCTHNK